MAEKITVKMHSRVVGPRGETLRAGRFAELEDSPYVRALVKGGHAELVDPPSFDYIDNPSSIGKSKAEAESKKEEPKAEAPKAEAPKAEAPKAEAPKAEAPKAERSKIFEPKLADPSAGNTGVSSSTSSTGAATNDSHLGNQ